MSQRTKGEILYAADGYPQKLEIINVGDGDDVFTEVSATVKEQVPAATQLRAIPENLPGMDPYTPEQLQQKRDWLYTVLADGTKEAKFIPEAQND